MKRCRIYLVLLLCLALLGSLVPALAYEPDARVDDALERVCANVLETVPQPKVYIIGGEWAVFGLARAGYEKTPQSYWDGYYATLCRTLREKQGVLSETRYTDYIRVVLTLTALGEDPRDAAGYDLLARIGETDAVTGQGVTAMAWALIALEAGHYTLSPDPRETYLSTLLARQHADGGWSLTGDSDADVTAMALQGLWFYRDRPEVSAAVERGFACLSGMQLPGGGFETWDAGTCESAAQAVIALALYGVPMTDPRFVKNGHTALDALLAFQRADGSFSHLPGGSRDEMACEQAMLALCAVSRAAKGQSSVYAVEDSTVRVLNKTPAPGLPGRHADVSVPAVTAPGTSFSDITAHPDRRAIEALAARGIVGGMGNGRFEPDKTMTRAQFAAITVRALGLPQRAGQEPFTDVPADSWYAPWVGAANAYGIVNGRGGGIFDPEGTITRQEAAVMVARAAALCGMDTALTDSAVRDALSPFSDARDTADWAGQGLAFCYESGLLDDTALTCQPLRPILRCEIAVMLFRLLERAQLL